MAMCLNNLGIARYVQRCGAGAMSKGCVAMVAGDGCWGFSPTFGVGSSIGQVHVHSSIGTAQRVSLELIILQDPLRSGLGSQLRILSSLHVDGPMAFQASYSGKAPQLPCWTISRMRLR